MSGAPRRGRRLAGLLAAALAAGTPAAAQDGPALRPGHVFVAGGLVWTGGYDVGTQAATLRGNATGTTSPPPYTLFTAAGAMGAAAGGDLRAGVAITRALAVEVSGQFTAPRLGVAIADDPEAGAQALDGEPLTQYVVDVSATWQLSRLRLGRRARPFVAGGTGYLRQLHEERALVETGRTYHAGGGLRYWLRGGDGRRHDLGVRADLRYVWRTGGLAFEDGTRGYPAASVLGFFGF
jgi:hypothetical protein